VVPAVATCPRKYAGAFILAISITYVISYFAVSRIYIGNDEGERITFRLFDHEWERELWSPLAGLENALRQGEFEGHTRNGASLPPAAE
jgi:hypothetical protein